jgi:hypothetical protein
MVNEPAMAYGRTTFDIPYRSSSLSGPINKPRSALIKQKLERVARQEALMAMKRKSSKG